MTKKLKLTARLFKRLFRTTETGLRFDDLNPEVRKALLNSGYTTYVDPGIKRTLFGLLRMTGRKPCVYILDRRQEEAHPRLCRVSQD